MFMNCMVSQSISSENHDLVELINNSDSRAFDALYESYWLRLRSFGLRYLNDLDTCEEIVQELFIQLHCQKLPLKVNASISSYLYGAMRNRIFNYLRKQAVYKRHIRNASANDQFSTNDVELLISARELQKTVDGVLAELPIRYREVYLLRESSRMPLRTIASLLNRPIDTVDKQLRKVQRLVKERIIGYDLN
ncbi:MAG: sigma-70 family RNA polymerase sigma factor [Chitinophagaceae bacterium]|nr:MAG: sigma-70 family RNA polymerase sigma factor [Chitinophagaceae bacterium]